jgi:hypothetical protein
MPPERFTMKYELLKATRSGWNESKAKEVYGVISLNGIIQVYIPYSKAKQANKMLELFNLKLV